MKPTGAAITGTRIRLEPFTRKHLTDPRYASWLHDYEVMRYIGRPEYLTPAPSAEIVSYVEKMWASPYIHFFAIHTTDGQFIGTAKANYLDDTGVATKTIDIGIMIGDRMQWGKGYASEAIRLIAKHCFTTLGARKLTAGTNERNIGTIRIFEKAGFVIEGRLRKKLLCEGEYCDHLLFGCFPEEYHA